MFKKIVVIGMGYVGIPAAALFADVEGFDVIGVQRRSKRSGWKIDYLNKGKNPIGGKEPGLSELIRRVVLEKKSFKVTDDISVCREGDAILIDVQTPVDKNHIPRYESLREVCVGVGKYMKKGALVVVESTVAPGTTDNIVKPILEERSGMRAGKDFYLAFSYERVMVGRLIHNIVHYPRIVGGINKESTERAMELYRHVVKEKLYPTDSLTAEVAKVVENTYRDVNIAFANEVALICESLGIDVFEIRELVNTLPINSDAYRNMHKPGAGVGGHCLPKDPWLLKYGLDIYGKKEFIPNLIMLSRNINDYMPIHMTKLIESAFEERGVGMKNSKISILGLAFIENSDDTRNSPAYTLYNELMKKGADVIVHDAFVKSDDDVRLTNDLEDAVKNADCIALVTAHDEYRNIKLDFLKARMRTPIIVDGRNLFNKDECLRKGFTFRGVGK